jgi:hypothetical protein
MYEGTAVFGRVSGHSDRTTPFGGLAILDESRTHDFASHPYGWFALIVEPGSRTLPEKRSREQTSHNTTNNERGESNGDEDEGSGEVGQCAAFHNSELGK